MRQRYLAGAALIVALIVGALSISARLAKTQPTVSTKSEMELATEKLEELLNEKYSALLASLEGRHAKEFHDSSGFLSWIVAKENGSHALRITVRVSMRDRQPAEIPIALSGIKYENP